MSKIDLIKDMHEKRSKFLRHLTDPDIRKLFLEFDMAVTDIILQYAREQRAALNLFYVPTINHNPLIEEVVSVSEEQLKRKANEN